MRKPLYRIGDVIKSPILKGTELVMEIESREDGTYGYITMWITGPADGRMSLAVLGDAEMLNMKYEREYNIFERYGDGKKCNYHRNKKKNN